MTQVERRKAFQDAVQERAGPSDVKPQYGVSNSAHFSASALRVGIPNLVNYKDRNGSLIVVSELTPVPSAELHIAVEVEAGSGVPEWLSTMTSGSLRGFSATNNNVAMFLAPDGQVYLHNKGKEGTDNDRVGDTITEAQPGFPCNRVWIASHVEDSTGVRVRDGIVDWLLRSVGSNAVEILGDGSGGGQTALARSVEDFSDALRGAGLSYGIGHFDTVRAFVVSMVTKRLVILTGLSGSGKTQIALRFGEWLGAGRSRVIAVRPDWTGPEYLLGYEDVLRERSEDGRGAWQVPEALAFMLKAGGDPENAYLLLLDEMNLAHVERYFADILSGMESGAPCLPNLAMEDGVWRVIRDEPEKIALPRNLFVVGTVNVDETTYMFSPKVLDRANSLEFRVGTEELDVGARRPGECPPAETQYVTALISVAKDDSWHADHPHPNEDRFASALRQAHALLGRAGFEFGHRVFFEALRFAAILAAAGDLHWEAAVDLQVLQKVLPRLHGSRRQLESTLCLLASYCHSDQEPRDDFDPTAELSETPRFPLSFDKLQRMTKRLRANQFVSFAE